ncbi:MAG: conjugal transfer protein TraW [Proteobacteria bacterium]|nr:conjugal transfer protein TraW [Pseudomonadota bacterium]
MLGRLEKIILIGLVIPTLAAAKDLGRVANTFEIVEEPFSQMMKRKLEQVDMEQERKKMESIARDRVKNPIPVTGIMESQESRTFYYDPTYTLEEDAVLPCGKVLHKAGTKVNPLDHMDLNRRLFFVDSRKENQIEWLEEKLNNPINDQKEIIEDRIILVGGSVFKLKEKLGEKHADKIYFDQSGELTTKFGIKSVPAVALQEDKKIRVDEIFIRK